MMSKGVNKEVAVYNGTAISGRPGLAGFTMIEILIALFITGLLMTGIYSLYNSFYRQTSSQELLIEAQQNTRAGIQMFQIQLSQVGLMVDPAFEPIATAEEDTIEFRYKDMDTGLRMSVTYTQTDDMFSRRECVDTSMAEDWTGCDDTNFYSVVDNLKLGSGFVIVYLDEFGDPIATPITTVVARANIRYIKVTITTETTAPVATTGEKKEVSATVEIRLRNLFTETSESAGDSDPPDPIALLEVREDMGTGRSDGVCGQLKLRWSKNTEGDVAGYKVFYNMGSGETATSGSVTVPLADLTSISTAYEGAMYEYTLAPGKDSEDVMILQHTPSNDLASSNTYEIQVRAYDTSFNLADSIQTASANPSPSKGASTFGDGGDNDTTLNPSKPTPITGFDAADAVDGSGDVINEAVQLSWDSYDTTNNPGVIGFRIYRSTSPFSGTYPLDPADAAITLVTGEEGHSSAPNILLANATTFQDTGLVGCQNYYYAIAPVNCDSTLITDDASDVDAVKYTSAEYTHVYGDADGNAFLDVNITDYPNNGTSDSTPEDTVNPPKPTIVAIAGWQRVFLQTTNPTLDTTPDYDHTSVYVNTITAETSCPTVGLDRADTFTYGVISSGNPIPNTDSVPTDVADNAGMFYTPGSSPPATHVEMCEDTSCTNIAVLNGITPSLDNNTTYCYLGVAYDMCGNPDPIEEIVTTLAEMCGDDPVGPPGDGTMNGSWPDGGSTISVSGCDETGGLTVSWSTMDHTFPLGYYDGALYRLHMLTGAGVTDYSGVNPSNAASLKAFTSAPNTSGSTLTAGPIVAGISDGSVYSFGITATDCVYENSSDYPANYSGWLKTYDVAPGKVLRDEKCQGAGSCTKDDHREVLTGVDINPTGTSSISSTNRHYHSTVTMFLDHSSAGQMTIHGADVTWVNTDALLTAITIGGGRSGVGVISTSISTTPSNVTGNDPYKKTLTGLTLTDVTLDPGVRYVPITFEFEDSSGNPVDMREDSLLITLKTRNETTGTDTCENYPTVSESFEGVTVPFGPSLTSVQQSEPAVGTSAYAVPGISGSNSTAFQPEVSSMLEVTVSVLITSNTTGADGNKIDINMARLRYKVLDGASQTTSIPLAGFTTVVMTDSNGGACSGFTNGICTADIPISDGSQVWYYIITTDADGNFDRAPEIDDGGYVYFQKVFDACDVDPNPPTNLSIDSVTDDDLDGFNDVTLSWTAPTEYTNGVTISPSDTISYNVYRSGASWSSFTAAGTTVTDTGVIDGGHTYEVYALNSCSPFPRWSWTAAQIGACIGGSETDAYISLDSWTVFLGDSFNVTILDCYALNTAMGYDLTTQVLNQDAAFSTFNVYSWNTGDNYAPLVPETGPNTGTFEVTIGTTTDVAETGKILTSASDNIEITYSFAAFSQWIWVEPDPCADIPVALTNLTGTVAVNNRSADLSWDSWTGQNTDLTWSNDFAGYRIYEKVCVNNVYASEAACTGANIFRDWTSVASVSNRWDPTVTLTPSASGKYTSYVYFYKVVVFDTCGTPVESADSNVWEDDS